MGGRGLWRWRWRGVGDGVRAGRGGGCEMHGDVMGWMGWRDAMRRRGICKPSTPCGLQSCGAYNTTGGAWWCCLVSCRRIQYDSAVLKADSVRGRQATVPHASSAALGSGLTCIICKLIGG